MREMLDFKVLELLSARLCHDLISPVSAINNGVELIAEFDDQMQGEALDLIGESARSASHLLQFYRAAHGSARSAGGGPFSLAEAKQCTMDCLGDGRVEIVWPDAIDLGGRSVSRLGVKLLMNLVMLGVDILPGSGRLSVSFSPGESTLYIEIHAEKDGLVLTDEYRSAITGGVVTEDLTPRTVVGYFCHALAGSLGRTLEVIERPSSIIIGVSLPWA